MGQEPNRGEPRVIKLPNYERGQTFAQRVELPHR